MSAMPAYPFKRTRVLAFDRNADGSLSLCDIVEFGGRTALNVRTVKQWVQFRDAAAVHVVRGLYCSENGAEQFLPKKTKVVRDAS